MPIPKKLYEVVGYLFFLIALQSCTGYAGNYETGDFKVSWTDRGSSVDFLFITTYTYTFDMWSAFAFSNDALMVIISLVIKKLELIYS